MALELKDLTYGRNLDNTKDIKNNLDGDIERVRSALTGSAYSDFKKTIAKYWNGADKDAFIKDFDQRVNSISSNLTKIKKYVDDALVDDYKTFVGKQKNHYTPNK